MNIDRFLDRLTRKKDLLQSKRPLSPAILSRLQDMFALEYTYHSNGIEGNTLTLQETQLVLREGLTIRGKSLREHFEAKNHEKAIVFVEQLVAEKQAMNEHNLLQLHELILDNVDQQWAGRYRNAQVRISGSLHVPPNARKVPEQMKALLRMVRRISSQHPVLHAAEAHHTFVNIHPFFDGNGRTGRLLMNFVLLQAGYPPAIILKNDRMKYYDALEQAHHGNPERLQLIVAQATERSLDLYLEAIEETDDDNQYQLLRDLAPVVEISQEYLSLLARQGKIDAFKQSRNWFSSKRAVEEYLENRLRHRKR